MWEYGEWVGSGEPDESGNGVFAGPRSVCSGIVSGHCDTQQRVELCDGDRDVQNRIGAATSIAHGEFRESELGRARTESGERGDRGK